MNTIKSLIVLLGFICHAYSTEPCKKVCILDNVDCVTKGGFNVYKTVVNGVEGLIEPLDPLHIDSIEGELENVKYKLTNITVRGLKSCTVTKLVLNATSTKWRQYLRCPKLVSHFNFEAPEETDKPVLRGKGTAALAAYNYDIVNYGLYSVLVNDDHRPHLFVVTQDSKSKPFGRLIFGITNVHDTDAYEVITTDKYMNEHWQQTENFLHRPIIKRAMQILIDKIDVYIKKTTMGEVLPF